MPKIKKYGQFTVSCGHCKSRVEYTFDETQENERGERTVDCPACQHPIRHEGRP